MKTQKCSWLKLILMFMVVAQFIVIMHFNYAHVYSLLDIDAAMGIRQIIEQWKNGIFLKDFVFATTLSIDYACFISMPIYFITGDLGLAMMIGQIILYITIAVVLWDICKNLNVTIEHYLFVILLIFTPYSLDVLDYAYLLFVSVGYWAYRVVVLLLLFDLFLMCKDQDIKTGKFLLVCISSAVLLFWTSLSTGNYVLCMVVLPFALYILWDIVEGGKAFWKMKECWIIVLCMVVCIAGWKFRNANIAELGRNHNDLSLLTADQLFDNFKHAIAGAFMLLGGLTNLENVPVFSWFGFLVLLKLGFTCLCIIFVVRECVKKRFKEAVLRMFFCVFLINMGVLLLTNTSYSQKIFEIRYHMLWCISFLMISGLVIMNSGTQNAWFNWLLRHSVIAMIAMINVGGFYYLSCQLNEKQYEKNILAFAELNQVDTIFIYDDPSIAYHLRVMDMEKKSVGVTNEWGYMAINNWGYYNACAENVASDGPNVLICREKQFNLLPSYIQAAYVPVEGLFLADGIKGYYGEYSPWDYLCGFPLASEYKSVDFPYTRGYTLSGELDQNGYLYADENDLGVILTSPDGKVTPGEYSVTVTYEIINPDSRVDSVFLELTANNGQNVLVSDNLPANQRSFTLTGIVVESEIEFQIRICKSDDSEVLIKKIVFERMQ